MIPSVDHTHDPARGSWVDSANDPLADFPLQNLPFGVFRPAPGGQPRIGVAIGSAVLDLRACAGAGLLTTVGTDHSDALRVPDLNGLLALGPDARLALRHALHALLRDRAPATVRARAAEHVFDASTVELLLPARVGDFTDYFASREHAANVVAVVPNAAMPAPYAHLPLGYHGRTSSIVVSPASIRRPRGQRRSRHGYLVAPSRRLDFELEVGLLVGPGSRQGRPIPIEEAEAHLFGACLLNDWSARDIQALESEPLGPFLSKSFATSISPWVITAEALAPFRVAQAPNTARDANLPAYLDDVDDRRRGAVDISLDAFLSTARMRERGAAPAHLAHTNLRSLYWTPAQLIAHQASGGAPLRPGDLLGTGTVSGPTPETGGSLMELTRAGRASITLEDGVTRAFLEDGDEVIFTAEGADEGAARIGFGECRGRVVPAR